MPGQTDALFDVPTTEALIEQTDQEIERVRERRSQLQTALSDTSDVLARLEASRKALLKRGRSEKRAARATRTKTAAERAGRGNVEAALKLIRRKPMTKAQITSNMGINNGTVTYALRALEEDGLIRETGKKYNGSKQYEPVPGRRVSRPGT